MSVVILIGLLAASFVVASLVAIAVLTLVCLLVERSRARTQRILDDRERRLRAIAAVLSDDLRAGSHDARVRLIEAAHAAMSEQHGSRPEERGRS